MQFNGLETGQTYFFQAWESDESGIFVFQKPKTKKEICQVGLSLKFFCLPKTKEFLSLQRDSDRSALPILLGSVNGVFGLKAIWCRRGPSCKGTMAGLRVHMAIGFLWFFCGILLVFWHLSPFIF